MFVTFVQLHNVFLLSITRKLAVHTLRVERNRLQGALGDVEGHIVLQKLDFELEE